MITREGSPTVTVYITNYNYARYLKSAIESVLGQTFKNFELIIIDDGSIDGSQKIMQEYGQLKAQLEKQANRLDDFDLLIGATAKVNNLKLVTYNQKHFARIASLNLVN